MVIQGVIRPPPEIRAVADRTALYVAKNGRAFETRILGSEKGKTPKFAFLHGSSPFHAYYEEKIQFYEEGGEDSKENDPQKEKNNDEKAKKEKPVEPRKEDKRVKTSVVDPVAKALLAQLSKISQFREAQEEAAKEDEPAEAQKTAAPIPAPPVLQFVNIVAPSSLSMVQTETIQLVAQFTALDGKSGSFLSQLTLREWNNPAFAFCQPRHGHFAYFSALVDAYRHVLGVWTGSNSANDSVKEMSRSVEKCLDLAAYRAAYERDAEEQARKRDDTASGAAQVDWHDFVVVETIDFPADEKVELSMLPPPPVTSVQPQFQTNSEDNDEDMDESDSEDDEQIRVVPSYQPKVVSSQTNRNEMVIDPISGKSVPIKDMQEHMRIQLLDPKWAEERKKFQEKQKDSNLVGGDVVASNLARFSQARGDMFGAADQDMLSKGTDSKKRLEEANRIIWQQAQNPAGGVGPTLPVSAPQEGTLLHHNVPAMDIGIEPSAKRPRVDTGSVIPLPPPPPPPPPPPLVPQSNSIVPPPGFSAATEDPFTISGSAPSQGLTEGNDLLSESDFVASLSKPEVTLQIRVPNDPTQMAWNFYGQIVSLSINVMSTVKVVKQEVSRVNLNNMPANKIQLKNTATGAFLKDSLSLAALNLGPSASLELVPKTRGGRK
jgi:splicing factor 3A subunit 1